MTLERRSRGGEGRSPVHPFDPAVILLVSYQSSASPIVFWLPASDHRLHDEPEL